MPNRLADICDKYGLTPEGVDFALSQYQRVLWELTQGRLSKMTYRAEYIITTVNDLYCEGCDYKEDRG